MSEGHLEAVQRGMVPKATSELSCVDTAAAPLGTDLAVATADVPRPNSGRRAAPGAWRKLGAAAATLRGWAPRCSLASDSKAHVGMSRW